MENKLKCNMFGGINRDSYNVLMSALMNLADENNCDIYKYLEETPKTSLVVEIVDEIINMGYKITINKSK